MGYPILVKMVKAVVSYFYVSLESHFYVSLGFCYFKIGIGMVFLKGQLTPITHRFIFDVLFIFQINVTVICVKLYIIYCNLTFIFCNPVRNLKQISIQRLVFTYCCLFAAIACDGVILCVLTEIEMIFTLKI